MALTISQKAGWGLADMGIVVFVIIIVPLPQQNLTISYSPNINLLPGRFSLHNDIWRCTPSVVVPPLLFYLDHIFPTTLYVFGSS